MSEQKEVESADYLRGYSDGYINDAEHTLRDIIARSVEAKLAAAPAVVAPYTIETHKERP